jgi:hypothetical protein
MLYSLPIATYADHAENVFNKKRRLNDEVGNRHGHYQDNSNKHAQEQGHPQHNNNRQQSNNDANILINPKINDSWKLPADKSYWDSHADVSLVDDGTIFYRTV